ERVRKMTNQNVLISTFHSLGARILRESIHFLGYTRDFTIYDEEDAEKVLRACIDEIIGPDDRLDTKSFRSFITKAKNNLLTPDRAIHDQSNYIDVYSRYQKLLKDYNAVDFDDLLLLTVKLFREHPDVLESYQQRWSYLLIDEYQDTNRAQY